MVANLLKNNSTQGIYILEEEDGQIANDTPGEIDLANLSLGDTYLYLEVILRFEEKTTFNKEGVDWTGFHTWQTSTLGARASTGGGMRTYYMISAEADQTTGEHLKTLAALNVIATDGIKYLVKQTASEAFEKFPNVSGANKNATAVVIRGFDIVEMETKGPDVKLINIGCERITSRL